MTDIGTYQSIHDPDTGFIRQASGEMVFMSNGVAKATLDGNGNWNSSAGNLIDIGDATAYTLLAANSGKAHYIANLTGSLTVTLPTPAAGLSFTFRYRGIAADAQNWVFDSGSDTNYFLGGLLHIDTDAGDAGDEAVPIAGDGNSNSKLTIVTPDVGTEVTIVCLDAVTWVVNGVAVSATVPAFADQ